MSPEARERARLAAAASLAAMTDEEDAAITADAEADPDSRPMTDEEFARSRAGRPPGPGGRKLPVSIRLDPEVVEALKGAGPGWQTRANALLREALKLDA